MLSSEHLYTGSGSSTILSVGDATYESSDTEYVSILNLLHFVEEPDGISNSDELAISSLLKFTKEHFMIKRENVI